MHIDRSAELDDYGYQKFIGHVTDVQDGDLVLDKTYSVTATKPAEHFRKPATELTLAPNPNYTVEATSVGRATLQNTQSLYFWRKVLNEDSLAGEEEELYTELSWCGELDEEAASLTVPEHHGHSEYITEWRGACVMAPSGMLVGINLEPVGLPPRPQCKIVDSVYPSGVVIFTDGDAFQSHPDKEWIGWLKA